MAICLLLLSYVFVVYIPWKINHEFRTWTFSSDVWLSSDAEKRGWMAEDLIAKNILMGRSKQEVLELLGPAEKNRFVSTEEEKIRLDYYLKFMRSADGFTGFPSQHWLVVWFDKTEKVIRAEIFSDD